MTKKIEIINGPGRREIQGPDIYYSNDKVSFRLLAAYDYATDQIGLHLDVKKADQQNHASIFCNLSEKGVGNRISPTDPLIVPTTGVLEGLAVQVDRESLIEALEGLARALK